MERRLRFLIPQDVSGEPPATAVQLYGAATIGISVAYAVATSSWFGGHPVLARLLQRLALAPGRLTPETWHTVASHWLLQPSLLELSVLLVVLFTAGVWVERRLGTARFAVLFAASGLWSAGMAMLTASAPVAGGWGPVLGVLGAAVALDGRRSYVGRLSGRTVWAVLACCCLAMSGAYHLGELPFAHASVTAALPLTALVCALPAVQRRRAARRYLRHGMAELAEEHVARERVDALLAKISSDGIEALTRAERRDLERASRFFTGGKTPDAPARERRTRTRAQLP